VLCVYGSGFDTRPEDGFFRVVFLADPAELATIYDLVADFTGDFLSRRGKPAPGERSESNGPALSERSESNGPALSERSESNG
jgi:hypothetical protein